MHAIRINESDNVAVALEMLPAGTVCNIGEMQICLTEQIPMGHKFAIAEIPEGDAVIKYGWPIGHAIRTIPCGAHVHTMNLCTNLDHPAQLQPEAAVQQMAASAMGRTFHGYLREDGRAATRNEIWILPTVGCVNQIAAKLAELANASLLAGTLEGVYAFEHPYGCSQLGGDHENTKNLLLALANHPNAGGVLFVGLGCENNQISSIREEMCGRKEGYVDYLICQDVEDEIAEGLQLLQRLAEKVKRASRTDISVQKLVVGLKCGGSDGLSGITANCVLGRVSDHLSDAGAAVAMTEIPEIFGAEQCLLSRCAESAASEDLCRLIDRYKEYYRFYGLPVYENPSPGNKAGGITTLEEKSLGCIQKSGRRPIVQVLQYAKPIQKSGVNVISAPGNDLVSMTALAASGAQVLLFTTGRGTPAGAPVPTIKVSTNEQLARKKQAWIDYDASVILLDESVDACAQQLISVLLQVAGGKQTCSEKNGNRQIAIFKNGVTL